MVNIITKKAIVRAVRDMNLRVGAPSLAARAVPVAKGSVFFVTGYVKDGDAVRGNAKWYATADGKYIWSENVEMIAEAPEKILHAPLARLICTQKFGERPEVYKKYGSPKGHNGLDFRTWVDGDPKKWKQAVFAVMDGTVSEAASDPLFKGNFTRIVHENAFESVYLHLSKLGVKKGQKVRAGEEIGRSGNTGGASEAPHLHFCYRPVKYDKQNGYMGYIDPAPLFIDEIVYI